MSDTGAQQCPLDNDIESRLGIVCSFVCTCNVVPNKGQGGINLKQSCVDLGLMSLNETCDTSLRVQVPYYMGSSPPSPLLLKDAEGLETIEPIRNFGHAINRVKGLNIAAGVAAGMVKEEVESYTRGDMRIPDAVALRDPNGKPTQDNLLGVIEVNFPPDDWGPGQKADYEEIAGHERKLHLLTPERCECDGPRQQKYAPATQPAMVVYQDRLEQRDRSWLDVAGGVATVAVAMGLLFVTRGRKGASLARTGASRTMESLGRAPAW